MFWVCTLQSFFEGWTFPKPHTVPSLSRINSLYLLQFIWGGNECSDRRSSCLWVLGFLWFVTCWIQIFLGIVDSSQREGNDPGLLFKRFHKIWFALYRTLWCVDALRIRSVLQAEFLFQAHPSVILFVQTSFLWSFSKTLLQWAWPSKT